MPYLPPVRALLAAAAVFAAGTAHADPTPPIAPGDTLLTIPAEGKVSAAPDMATVSAGVVTTAGSAAAAMADNAAAMARAIAALKAAGVAERDIQTSSLNLSPQFAQNQPDNAPPRIVGYRASNTVSVRLREVGKVGAALDALVAAGANEINGPEFALAAPDAALDQARVQAIGTARARADLYAKAAGLHVTRIVSISEDGGDVVRPMPVVFMAARKIGTPVAAGSLDMAAHVTVMFELAP